MKEKQHRRTYFGFMILMIALGASDAVRGVFTPIFSEHFSLSAAQLSTIVTAGYLGNLVFLMFCGRVVDKLDRRVSFLGLTVLWMLALAMYCLRTVMRYWCSAHSCRWAAPPSSTQR